MIIEMLWKRDRSFTGYLDANAEIPSQGDYVHIYVNGTPNSLMVETRTFFYDNENQLNKVQLMCIDPTDSNFTF
jgi:hypothetical protein